MSIIDITTNIAIDIYPILKPTLKFLLSATTPINQGKLIAPKDIAVESRAVTVPDIVGNNEFAYASPVG